MKGRKVIGHVNGGGGGRPADLVGRIVDLGSHRPKDPLDIQIDRVREKISVEENNKRWAAGFEEAASKGAVPLLAYLLSGSQYDASNVEAFAASVFAAMTAAGFLVIRKEDLQGFIENAVKQVREGKVDATTQAEDPTN